MAGKKKADLHVHTNFSKDASSSPEEIVDAAVSKGIHVICIADHNTIEGALLARKYAKEKYPDQIEVIIGEEIDARLKMTEQGHIIAIGIEEKVPKHLPLYDAIARIHKQNAVALAPHVFAQDGLKMLAFSNDVDCVESYESTKYNVLDEGSARETAQKYGIPAIATSGAHRAEDVGRAVIFFKGDLIKSLLLGDFTIYGAKSIPFVKEKKRGRK